MINDKHLHPMQKTIYCPPQSEVISLEHREPVLDAGSPVIPLGALLTFPTFSEGVEEMEETTYDW